MPACFIICESCGNRQELDPREGLFFGGLKTGYAYYKNCYLCCDPEEPEFENIEHALVSYFFGGRGYPWAQRKWFAYNTPLPEFDTDEEVYEFIDVILYMKGK